jgi:hypothetical protein
VGVDTVDGEETLLMQKMRKREIKHLSPDISSLPSGTQEHAMMLRHK